MPVDNQTLNEVLQNLRVSHQLAKLDIQDCDPDPIRQFDKWLENAIESQCDEPNAFTLSTVVNNKPRGRVLLLKGVHDNKLVFYTNYLSSKGQELDQNENVALTFLWLPLQRQIRIEGRAVKVDPETSDDYFKIRPRGSQLGAIASPQSNKVSTREELEKMFAEAEKKFKSVEALPRPSHWGGYAVEPTYFEFWQGRNNRMHDRIFYEKSQAGWTMGRLAP